MDRDQAKQDWAHPGQHALSKGSWWCDRCLSECARTITEEKTDHPWQDFFYWIGPAAARMFGLALTSLTGLIIFIIGRDEWYVESLSHFELNDLRYRLEGQRERLLGEREASLTAIERLSGDFQKALMDNCQPGPDVIADDIDRAYRRLERTMAALADIDRKIDRVDILLSEGQPQSISHAHIQGLSDQGR